MERGDGRIVAGAVKLASAIDDEDVRHLHWLGDQIGDRLLDKVVLCTGPAAYRRPDGVAVIPLALLGPCRAAHTDTGMLTGAAPPWEPRWPQQHHDVVATDERLDRCGHPQGWGTPFGPISHVATTPSAKRHVGAVMAEAGIRDLRDHLSRHLARVRAGEELVITDSGRPVARLVPVEGAETFERLVADGLVTPAVTRVRERPTTRVAAADPVSELVAEQRR